jgi:hypothetical protein
MAVFATCIISYMAGWLSDKVLCASFELVTALWLTEFLRYHAASLGGRYASCRRSSSRIFKDLATDHAVCFYRNKMEESGVMYACARPCVRACSIRAVEPVARYIV